MHNVGIDALAVYTSRYMLDLALLAERRNIDPEKYRISLGQYNMSVPPPGEDIVTMAANAAQQVLNEAKIDVNDIAMLLFATESASDHSKAAGIYVHRLLQLSPQCRIVELKQACYSATAAIQLSLPYLRENPQKKVLVIAADIARYALHSAAESSQGCGAIAIILAANPRILAIENEYGVMTEDVMDFWRPNYLAHALVDGKASSKLYLAMLEKTWQHYCAVSKREFKDHAAFCYHAPVPRLVENAHKHLLKLNQQEDVAHVLLQASLHYSREIGNSYSAALYVCLTSLLDLAADDLTHKRIGFYSYGSGCVAEYFSGIVQADYQRALQAVYHQQMLAERIALSYDEYEAFYAFQYPEDGQAFMVPQYNTGAFRLVRIEQHKRIYEAVEKVTLVEFKESEKIYLQAQGAL